MNNNIDLKKILSITCYILLIFAGVHKFITISNEVSIDTYLINGYAIVMIAFLFFIYSIFVNKKLLYYLASAFITAGYFYTFYSVIKAYSRGYSTSISLKIGFYLYLFSSILFIISLLTKSKEQTSDEKNINEVKQNNNVTKQKNYIIGTYLYGIKGKQEFCNNSCAVTTNGNTKDLIIILTSKTSYNYEIKYSQIEKITVKQGISMNHGSTKLSEDYTAEKMMLGYALAGIWGSMLAEELNSSSDKIKYEVGFTVEINYKKNEETKKVVIEFPKNPDYFFQSYDNLYKKIS